MKKKRFFGYFELIFDLFYLLFAFFLGIKILLGAEWVWQLLAGSAALVLGGRRCFPSGSANAVDCTWERRRAFQSVGGR